MKEPRFEMPEKNLPVFCITKDGIGCIARWDGMYWVSDSFEQSFGKNIVVKWTYCPDEFYDLMNEAYYYGEGEE